MNDTSPEAALIQMAIYRRMSGEQRLRLAMEMSEFARELCLAGIRRLHPDWSDAQVRREMLRWTFLPAPVPEWLDAQWEAAQRAG